MTRFGVFFLTVALLLGAASARGAFGDVRRERTERRPYVEEIGEPYAINPEKLQYEINHISELQTYVSAYGYPDYAEIQEILPEWPWEPYEVRLYYLDRNLETDFSPVIVSPAFPNFGVLKFSGSITAEKRHEIELVLEARKTLPVPVPVAAAPAPVMAPAPAQSSSSGLTEALVARIEAAAERAAQAADRAAQDSEAAARAAERTVNIVDKMEQEGAEAP